ncbi:SlyX family protein [Amphritea sp. 1_MG-2023]|uniref:SlyX family protein n=1 Tax=Amphritea sp. 1_MG-2023 TaxID=3062670 RepID=UPI0026E4751C|nr:SlyX family protein [Amphritea sp. 1_MG-2023]MDO6565355.1 SlyX family protein [Amphritea sp. 1_MG-2023]
MKQQQLLEDLESRVAFQEDALDKMSAEMANQGAEIARLSQIIKILHQQVKQFSPDQISAPADDVPPPHY